MWDDLKNKLTELTDSMRLTAKENETPQEEIDRQRRILKAVGIGTAPVLARTSNWLAERMNTSDSAMVLRDTYLRSLLGKEFKTNPADIIVSEIPDTVRAGWTKWLLPPPGGAGRMTPSVSRSIVEKSFFPKIDDYVSGVANTIKDKFTFGVEPASEAASRMEKFKAAFPQFFDDLVVGATEGMEGVAKHVANSIKSGFGDKIHSWMWDNIKNNYSVQVPEGNINVLAHEMGHLHDFMTLRRAAKPLGLLFKDPELAAFRVAGLGHQSAHDYMAGLFPSKKVNDFFQNLKGRPQALSKVWGALPITAMTTTALGTSETARDLVRKIPWVGDTVADTFEENPIAATTSGYVPLLASEFMATLKGAGMEKGYFDLLKRQSPEIIKDLSKMEGLSISKVSPILQGVKSFAKNMPAFGTYVLPAALAAGAAYLMSKERELKNDDTSI